MSQLEAAEGYPADLLDGWAARLRKWANVGMVDDLNGVAAQKGKARKLDCFAYFISGDKERAPDAAMALLRRLEDRK